MKNIVLTSLLAVMVAAPAFADDDPYTNSNTYTGYCEIAHIGGTGTGSVNASANFTPVEYNCAAGTYLPDGDTWATDNQGCTQCPAGSYCEGGTYTYSEGEEDQGIEPCDELYPYSDAGSAGMLACYFVAPCPTISNGFCDPHATNCAYTNDAITTNGRVYLEGSPGPNMSKCSVTFSTCATGYTYSVTQAAPAGLPASATTPTGDQYRSHLYPDDGVNSNSSNDLLAGEWKVTWTGAKAGVMRGISSCNSVPGNSDTMTWENDKSNWTLPANTNLANNSADSSNASRYFCWCKPTSWTTVGGDTTNLSVSWVFRNSNFSAADCASECSKACADNIRTSTAFRSAVFTAMGDSKQCVPNTIMLTWLNANGGTHESNTCKYGENLQTPASPLTKRGFTFKGWRFVPQQSQNPEQE